ncbi:MAG: [FeFe] hydrogenase H-cluster maturation GTPase HydF [Bacillota bacterium]|nr:[FeFe] hydrogenase H-cluster maturation GTPase HydF [Bacillota bacterium]
MSLNDTPRANRLHIGIYGKRNAGKSSLINALTGQDIALVSAEAGTTTDPVFKSMELHPIGPVVFIDTAGFDDEGSLGKLRVERTKAVMEKTDVAIVVIDGAAATAADLYAAVPAADLLADEQLQAEKQWIEQLEEKNIPIIIAINKADLTSNVSLEGEASHPIIAVSAATGEGLDDLRKAIEDAVPEDYMREKILGDIIGEGDLALLVMPQDIQAPKGRLILPQVQTIRELLDRRCTTVATTADGFERALKALNRAPDLIITDSQCFKQVYAAKPSESALTSFSVLFAAYKGDIDKFLNGASLLDEMTENSRVLIAEACTHVPLNEDIGRVKIPDLLRKKFGPNIEITNICGNDFPNTEELKNYDLIIHCGACMFNRKHVLSRIASAEAAGVPITNYGVVMAKLAGILEMITITK